MRSRQRSVLVSEYIILQKCEAVKDFQAGARGVYSELPSDMPKPIIYTQRKKFISSSIYDMSAMALLETDLTCNVHISALPKVVPLSREPGSE